MLLGVIGAMSAAIPTTPKVLKTLEPIILPKAISCSPLRAADKLATNSGSDVPIATIVRPMISSLKPHKVASSIAPQTIARELSINSTSSRCLRHTNHLEPA